MVWGDHPFQAGQPPPPEGQSEMPRFSYWVLDAQTPFWNRKLGEFETLGQQA